MTKKQKKSPAFQFYPSDFLGSPKVRAMSLAEIGLYVLGMCIDWESDGFTDGELRALAESQRATPEEFALFWERVRGSFREKSGRHFNARLKEERDKQREWRRKCSKGGKLSAAKRGKGSSRVVEVNGNTPSPTPSPTPTNNKDIPAPDGAVRVPAREIPKKRSGLPPYDQLFEEAWAAYPKRPGNSKVEAWRQWLSRVGEGSDPMDMLAGVRRYAAWAEAEQTEPRYVKHAATFLGRDRHFEADWTPTRSPDALSDRIVKLVEEEDAALARTRELLAKRGVA